MANRNRTAGIRAELQIARELTDLGFDSIVTTRSESKRMDDKGVDLIQLPEASVLLPFYVQVKKSLSTPRVDLLENDLEKPLIIVYQKQEKRKSRFFTKGDYVFLKKDFFYKLLFYAKAGLLQDQCTTNRSCKTSHKSPRDDSGGN